jgi:hypothetical protein
MLDEMKTTNEYLYRNIALSILIQNNLDCPPLSLHALLTVFGQFLARHVIVAWLVLWFTGQASYADTGHLGLLNSSFSKTNNAGSLP